ncbi:MAG: hypothetical protein CMF22_11365 [Idiomarinaceae bacterium]|nr:hypothetical protein [Idiomarinaceae bacterium]|tara:strand:- start:108599 stop:110134 length:1536 start_codon:yes stop_codon:yes gene_type:complete
MTTLDKQLPTRVPSAVTGDNELTQYLEACGEVLEEFKDSIRAFDFYKDYKYSSEKRLALIARRFSFDLPERLEEHILRGIVRDLSSIYKTSGITKTINWVMRILSWDADIEELWLVFPERYQQQVELEYPTFYTAPNLTSELSKYEVFTPLVGQSYRVGLAFQNYAEDHSRIVDGYLLVGENSLLPEGALANTDPFSIDAGFAEFFDVDRVDIRNFVVGKPVYRDTGVYFKGRTQFSAVDNLFDLRILGEKYPNDHVRREQVVMKTPYLSIAITSDDYDQFIDGDDYTDKEKYNIAKELIEFLLYELFRPTNVKYVSLVAPLTFAESSEIHDESYERVEFDEDPFVETNPYYIPEADTYMPFDSHSGVLNVPKFENGSTDANLYFDFDTKTFTSWEPILIQGTDETTYEINGLTFDGNGYTTDTIVLRTPSEVLVESTGVFSIQYKKNRLSAWQTARLNVGSGTHKYRTKDMYQLRFVRNDDSTEIDVTVTWLSQKDGTQDFPLVPSLENV